MQIQTGLYKSDINRLLTALNHQEPDRLPHIELWVTSQDVYEYILERKLDYTLATLQKAANLLRRRMMLSSPAG